MIRINPLFFVLLAIATVLGVIEEVLLVVGIAILHEAGHAVCAIFLKCKNIRFYIHPWGVCMQCDPLSDARKELLVAAAGPAVNVFLLFIGCFFEWPTYFAANLFMLIINLLPVYPLDGGRILNAFLKPELGMQTTALVLRIVSGVVTVILFLAGGALLLKTKMNFSVLLAAFFLVMSADGEKLSTKTVPMQKVKHYAVPADEPARLILKMTSRNKAVVLDVVRHNHYLGSLTLREVMEEIAVSGYEIKFGEILEKHLLYLKKCSTI